MGFLTTLFSGDEAGTTRFINRLDQAVQWAELRVRQGRADRATVQSGVFEGEHFVPFLDGVTITVEREHQLVAA